MSGATFSNLLHDIQNAKVQITRKSDSQDMGIFYVTSVTALDTINEHVYEIRLLSNDDLVDLGVLREFVTLSNNDLCIIIISDSDSRITRHRLFGSGVTVYAKRVDIREGASTMFIASISEVDAKLFEFYTRDFDIIFITFKQFIGIKWQMKNIPK